MSNSSRRFQNKQVEIARTRICGHFHSIEIQLCFDDCIISINPKRSWFAENGVDKLGNKKHTMPFFDLFDCFDMDCENGADIEKLTGKYCRLLIDDDEVIAIYHIVKDKFVLVENLQ